MNDGAEFNEVVLTDVSVPGLPKAPKPKDA
jgi:hypothetical protein